MKFQKIKSDASSEWERFKDEERIHILVGTATCGRAAGAMDTLDTLRQKIEQHGIDAEITQVGCMGHCYAEPLVIISKPDQPAIIYGYATPGVASVLVDNYLLKSDPCLEFALGTFEIDEEGNKYLIWYWSYDTYDTNIMFKYWSTYTSTWSSSSIISIAESINNIGIPKINVDRLGFVYFVWDENGDYLSSDTDRDIFYKKFQGPPSAPTLAPIVPSILDTDQVYLH